MYVHCNAMHCTAKGVIVWAQEYVDCTVVCCGLYPSLVEVCKGKGLLHGYAVVLVYAQEVCIGLLHGYA